MKRKAVLIPLALVILALLGLALWQFHGPNPPQTSLQQGQQTVTLQPIKVKWTNWGRQITASLQSPADYFAQHPKSASLRTVKAGQTLQLKPAKVADSSHLTRFDGAKSSGQSIQPDSLAGAQFVFTAPSQPGTYYYSYEAHFGSNVAAYYFALKIK